MKNNVCLAMLMVFCSISSQARASQVLNESPVSANDALVCLVDFRIDLVVGKDEYDIGDSQYCKYEVDQKKFLSLLTSMSSSAVYMENNVRAKVSFSKSVVYFIDYNGVVRIGSKRFEIDKFKFIKMIRKI
jgi:hypothetical protein